MDNRIAALASQRWRIASLLTALTLVVYFGFVLLVAFQKPMMGMVLTRGLTLGILLGAGVIVAAWALTGIYVLWANRHYDGQVADLKADLERSR
jgi:uncharacterized membrane protein (DUF485 family)